MAKTYEPIATTTLTAGTASVTFSNIPQTYTDLVLVANIRISGTGGEGIGIRFNNDSGSNYSYTRVFASTSAVSDVGTNLTSTDGGYFPGSDSSSSLFDPGIYQIMNYSNTTTNKMVITRWNNNQNPGTTHVGFNAGLWRSTAAITSVTLAKDGGKTFVSGCSFTLYGIKAA